MKVLVVVDMQNDFVTGALANNDAQAIVPEIAKYMRFASNNDYRMIMTMDCHNLETESDFIEHYTVPNHCIQGTDGFDIVQPLLDIATTQFPDENWDTVCKSTFALDPDHIPWETFSHMSDYLNLLSRDEIEEQLEGIYLCGVCTDICVISNALMFRSMFPRVPIYVLSKLCAGTSREAHEAALQVMKNNCIVVT